MQYLTILFFFFTIFVGGCSKNDKTSTLQSKEHLVIYKALSKAELPINSSLIVNFENDINSSTLSSESVYITDLNTTQKIAVDFNLLEKSLKIIPKNFLELHHFYKLVITTALQNIEGATLQEDYEWSFEAISKDTTPPVLKTSLPKANQDVDSSTGLVLTFNEIIDSASVNSDTLVLKDSNNTRVDGVVHSFGTWIWFEPSATLKNDTTYTLSIEGLVYDLSANAFKNQFSITFHTNQQSLNSDGFGEIERGFHTNLSSYTLYLEDDNKTLNIGSDGKVTKLFIEKDSDSLPVFTKLKEYSSSSIGRVYEIKSCNNSLVVATQKGLLLLDKTSLNFQSFTPLEFESFSVAPQCQVDKEIVYVANSLGGVVGFDIADKTAPKKLETFAQDRVNFTVAKNETALYVGDFLEALDVYGNNLDLLQHIEFDATVQKLVLEDDSLLLCNGVDGLKRFTILSDGTLKLVDSFVSLTRAVDGFVGSKYAFILTSTKGISIVDKEKPQKIAYQISLGGRGVDFVSDGEFLYVLLEDGTLKTYAIESTQDDGKAVDGYLRGAKVFKDCNNNFLYDEGEPYSITDEKGEYKLVNTPYSCKDATLIVQGGVDTFTQLPFQSFLVAKDGSKTISPLTSLVVAKPIIKERVTKALNLFDIDEDFVETNKTTALEFSLKMGLSLNSIADNIDQNFSQEVFNDFVANIATAIETNSSVLTDRNLMLESFSQSAYKTVNSYTKLYPELNIPTITVEDFSKRFSDAFVMLETVLENQGDEFNLSNLSSVLDGTYIKVAQLEPLTLSIKENIALGSKIGTIRVLDDGNSDIESMQLSGDGAQNFTISSNGDVFVASDASLDFETKSVYNLLVTATNEAGESSAVSLTINILDYENVFQTAITALNTPQENAYFGHSVAAENGYVVVGIPNKITTNGNTGLVSLYREESDGSLVKLIDILPADIQVNDLFGEKVAINSDYILVSARGRDNFSGVVYLFKIISDTQVQEIAKITSNDNAEGDNFGKAIAIDDSSIVIGAPGKDLVDTDSGEVYLFTIVNDTNITQTAQIISSDAEAGDAFGSSVAIDNDLIVVGAPQTDPLDVSNAGSVYLFKNSNSNILQVAKTSIPLGAKENDQFGYSVAIFENNIVVGSPFVDGISVNVGAAYLYRFDFQENNLISVGEIQNGVGDGSFFGFSVDIDANHIAIGSPAANLIEQVVLYNYKQTPYTPLVTLRSNSLRTEGFGLSVALDGENILVGAPNKGTTLGEDAIKSGAVYRFNLEAANKPYIYNFPQSEIILPENQQTIYSFDVASPAGGITYTLSGTDADKFIFNGNTLEFITPPDYELDKHNYRVDITFNDAQGNSVTKTLDISITDIKEPFLVARLAPETLSADDKFGNSIAVDGDYVVIGSYGDTLNGIEHSGSAYLYKKDSNAKLHYLTQLSPETLLSYEAFGKSVAISGDYIAIGAPFDDSNGSGSGSVTLFKRVSDTNITRIATLYAENSSENAYFGATLAIDGSYVAIGAEGQGESGSVYLFKIVSDENISQIAEFISGNSGSIGFSKSLSIDGDYIAVGSTGDDSVYLFKRESDDINDTIKIAQIHDEYSYNSFGSNVVLNGNFLAVTGADYGYSISIYERLSDDINNTRKISSLTSSVENITDIGDSLAWDGSYIVTSAIDYMTNKERLLLYEFDTTSKEVSFLSSFDAKNFAQENDGFALTKNLDISGNTIVVGAPDTQDAMQIDKGAAYIFDIDPIQRPYIYMKKLFYGSYGESLLNYPLYSFFVASPTNSAVTITLTGEDAQEFVIKDNNLSFVTLRDFENPQDSDFNNEYNVTLELNDARGLSYSDTLETSVVNNYFLYADKEKPLKEDYIVDDFGKSLALSNNYFVVGDPDDRNITGNKVGAVYLYRNDSNNSVTFIQKFGSNLSIDNASFGKSVAIDGDYIVVGAPDVNSSSGAVYIFKHFNDNNITQLIKLTEENGDVYHYFGESVAIDGDYIVVGSPGSSDTGVIYLYKKESDTNITQIATKSSDDGDGGSDFFGASVAISGDYIAVGAPQKDTNTGATYLLKRESDAQNDVSQIANLDTGGSLDIGDSFGASVAIDGDYIVVGSAYDDDNATDSGAFYLFKRNDDQNVVELAKVQSETPYLSAQFGFSVAIDGNFIIVGAPYDRTLNYKAGMVFLFERNSDSQDDVTQITKIQNSINFGYQEFGRSVALDGNRSIVGAKSNSVNGYSVLYLKDLDEAQ